MRGFLSDSSAYGRAGILRLLVTGAILTLFAGHVSTLRETDASTMSVSAPTVSVSLLVDNLPTVAREAGAVISVEVRATPRGEGVDVVALTIDWDPTYVEALDAVAAAAFDVPVRALVGARSLVIVSARRSGPVAVANTHVATLRFGVRVAGATRIDVRTSGVDRTRVAGNARELTVEATSLLLTAPVAFVPPVAVLPPAGAPPRAGGAGAPNVVAPSTNPTVRAGDGQALPTETPRPTTPDTARIRRQSVAIGAVMGIPVGFEPGVAPVASRFVGFYTAQEGMRLLGRPLGPGLGAGGSVQYFEKGRLEYYPDNPLEWQFQCGLLSDELATAESQLPIGGEVSSLTYADVAQLRRAEFRRAVPEGFAGGVMPLEDGSVFVPFDASLSPAPGQAVPAFFWEFVNGEGVFPGGWLHDVGLPMTPVIEAIVDKGEIQGRRIYVQVFQRTVLTYDPANPEGYLVECANVGTDYLRAMGIPSLPQASSGPEVAPVMEWA